MCRSRGSPNVFTKILLKLLTKHNEYVNSCGKVAIIGLSEGLASRSVTYGGVEL